MAFWSKADFMEGWHGGCRRALLSWPSVNYLNLLSAHRASQHSLIVQCISQHEGFSQGHVFWQKMASLSPSCSSHPVWLTGPPSSHRAPAPWIPTFSTHHGPSIKHSLQKEARVIISRRYFPLLILPRVGADLGPLRGKNSSPGLFPAFSPGGLPPLRPP